MKTYFKYLIFFALSPYALNIITSERLSHPATTTTTTTSTTTSTTTASKTNSLQNKSHIEIKNPTHKTLLWQPWYISTPQTNNQAPIILALALDLEDPYDLLKSYIINKSPNDDFYISNEQLRYALKAYHRGEIPSIKSLNIIANRYNLTNPTISSNQTLTTPYTPRPKTTTSTTSTAASLPDIKSHENMHNNWLQNEIDRLNQAINALKIEVDNYYSKQDDLEQDDSEQDDLEKNNVKTLITPELISQQIVNEKQRFQEKIMRYLNDWNKSYNRPNSTQNWILKYDDASNKFKLEQSNTALPKNQGDMNLDEEILRTRR